DRPAQLLESIRHYIQERIFGSRSVPTDTDLDRLADAIVSVEFYLETVQQGRGHHAAMLDNAEACVEALGFPIGYTPASSTDAELEVDEPLDAEATMPAPVAVKVEVPAAPAPAQHA